jgi:hypothetical protein
LREPIVVADVEEYYQCHLCLFAASALSDSDGKNSLMVDIKSAGVQRLESALKAAWQLNAASTRPDAGCPLNSLT